MPSAADSAWLIPVLPLIGALITGLGLISFNRTINRPPAQTGCTAADQLHWSCGSDQLRRPLRAVGWGSAR